MNGSNLTYGQIISISQNLTSFAGQMQNVLDEITTLISKIGSEDVWGGTAAEDSKAKFDSLSAKFAEFYKAVTDEATHLSTVVENYQKADTQIIG